MYSSDIRKYLFYCLVVIHRFDYKVLDTNVAPFSCKCGSLCPTGMQASETFAVPVVLVLSAITMFSLKKVLQE